MFADFGDSNEFEKLNGAKIILGSKFAKLNGSKTKRFKIFGRAYLRILCNNVIIKSYASYRGAKSNLESKWLTYEKGVPISHPGMSTAGAMRYDNSKMSMFTGLRVHLTVGIVHILELG